MRPARLDARLCVFVSGIFCAMPLFAPPSPCQTVGESPQQTNDRIQRLSAAVRTAPHDYVIGAGDVLDVEVFDVKELSREVRVSQTGTIGLPLVPVRLRVSGLTELQAEQKIAEVLQANGLVSHPEVTVSVKERKSKPITVVGAVIRPMVYQADGPVTLLEVLAQAGGVANDAGDTVIVTRPVPPSDLPQEGSSPPDDPPSLGPEVTPAPVASAAMQSPSAPQVKSPAPVDASTAAQPASLAKPPARPENTITINLNELVESGDATNNIPLQAGDIVTVPHAGIVYVLGAVTKPGGFVLANDRTQMSALKLLALAGGFTRTAKTQRTVIIRKDATGKEYEVPLDLRKIERREVEDVALLPSDIVYVPDSTSKEVLMRAAEFAIGLGSGVALYRLAYH
jgi:polysaccharide export outer membrane protein